MRRFRFEHNLKPLLQAMKEESNATGLGRGAMGVGWPCTREW